MSTLKKVPLFVGGFIDSLLIAQPESWGVGVCPELEQGWRGAGCFEYLFIQEWNPMAGDETKGLLP